MFNDCRRVERRIVMKLDTAAQLELEPCCIRCRLEGLDQIRQEFALRIDITDLVIENFASINTISAFIEKLKTGH